MYVSALELAYHSFLTDVSILMKSPIFPSVLLVVFTPVILKYLSYNVSTSLSVGLFLLSVFLLDSECQKSCAKNDRSS